MPIKYPGGSSGGGAPSGAAGGVLGGTYPNPSFAADMATQAELDAVATAKANVITEDTSFPGSPVASQFFSLLVDDTNGVEWLFRRNAANTKWRFQGGAALYAVVNTLETTATTVTWLDLATVGPSITVPVAGLYEISFGCYMKHGASAGNTQMGASVDGGAPATSEDALFTQPAASNSAAASVTKTIRATVATPATAIKAQYRNGTTGTATFDRRWMAILPIQI
jgi:hypothetical protein